MAYKELEMTPSETAKELENLLHTVDSKYLKTIEIAIKYINRCKGMDD